MPLVNQGKFQMYYNEKENILDDYDRMHQEYFPNDCYNPAFDVFSEFFYYVDFVFNNACRCKTNIQGLINSAEIKTAKSVEKLQSALVELDGVMNNCINDFQSVYDICKKSGFTKLENESFGNYNITSFIQR